MDLMGCVVGCWYVQLWESLQLFSEKAQDSQMSEKELRDLSDSKSEWRSPSRLIFPSMDGLSGVSDKDNLALSNRNKRSKSDEMNFCPLVVMASPLGTLLGTWQIITCQLGPDEDEGHADGPVTVNTGRLTDRSCHTPDDARQEPVAVEEWTPDWTP